MADSNVTAIARVLDLSIGIIFAAGTVQYCHIRHLILLHRRRGTFPFGLPGVLLVRRVGETTPSLEDHQCRNLNFELIINVMMSTESVGLVRGIRREITIVMAITVENFIVNRRAATS